MKSFFLKNSLLLGGALFLLFVSYLIFLSLSRRQIMLSNELIRLGPYVDQQTKKVRVLQTAFKTIEPFLTSHHAQFTPEALEKKLQKSAHAHHLSDLRCAFLPSKIEHHDTKFRIKKTPIQLSFGLKIDDHLWNFLKDLFGHYPGMIQSQALFIERAQDRKGFLLKGSYCFECYSLQSLTSEP